MTDDSDFEGDLEPYDDQTITDVDTVEKQFENYLQEAIKVPSTFPDRKKFEAARSKELSQTTRNEHRNFLHFLACAQHSLRKPLHWLVQLAVYGHPQDMGVLDISNQTPLSAAIAVHNEVFVDGCMKAFKKKPSEIKAALEAAECVGQDDDQGVETCLHLAIKNNLKPDLIKGIIENVSEKTFCVKDRRGCTPLHLAVDYERCSPSQVNIVSHLLRFSPPNALTAKMKKDSMGPSRSAYQHHEITRKLFERNNFEKRREVEKKRMIEMKRDERPNSDWELLEDEKMKKASLRIPSHSRMDSYRGPEFERPSLKRQGSELLSPPTQETSTPPEASEPGALENLSFLDRKQGPPKNTNPTNLQSQQTTDNQQAERKVSADKIREQLKLWYLRTTKPSIALHCLQTPDERDKQMWFDLGPEPKSKYTVDEFRKQFSHLKFDTVLQYVAFPQIQFIQTDESHKPHQRSRKDLVVLFQWLRDQGVKRIIKVIVDDLRKPCHSDEDIEKALDGFEVEILDWRRLDLCPITIFKVSKNLREIHLQWSGRNCVLRSWSEREGLAKVPSLKAIHLTQVEVQYLNNLCSPMSNNTREQILDSDDRTQCNLKEFGERLNQSWPDGNPKFALHLPQPKGDTYYPATEEQLSQHKIHNQEYKVDAHRWINCMKEFAQCFKNIKDIKNQNSDSFLNPVTVALIDDGVDIRHEDLQGDEFLGKSFSPFGEDSWRINPFWISAVGHGTLMARLIRHICPSAVIYVIKLETFEFKGKLRIRQQSAIEAIEHATERGAQIISMSWTTNPPSDTTAFDNAIKNASTTKKPVLMFCSASDQGHFSDQTYPHSSNPNSVFRIGASKATGNPADFVGDPSKLDFTFPGHEVDFDKDTNGEHFGRFASHTGSSVATALAAGLAALILECVRLGVIYTQEAKQSDPRMAINKEDLIKIRNKKVMMDALKRIGTGEQTQNKYIEVWNTFDSVTKKLKQEEGSRSGRLDVIAGLAQVLLNKGVKD